jgi:hypothetical protein
MQKARLNGWYYGGRDSLHVLTETGVTPKWRHTRSIGQSIAGRAFGWSGPSRVNNKQASYKQLTTMGITAECMEHTKF